MFVKILVLVMVLSSVVSAPQKFDRKYFKVGVEYDHSLPMCGGSDRYRHRNNYDPFFVTVTANAKKGFVISYVVVQSVVDEGGSAEFTIVRGNTGSKSIVFQLVSNHSDFLSYSYLAYGIREEEYKKITNIIHFPVGSKGIGHQLSIFSYVLAIIINYCVVRKYF